MRNGRAAAFVAAPNFGVALVAAACVLEFALCLRASGEATIPTSLLVANGALTPQALEPGQWWRLLAYGGLHANPMHLAMNMVSLFVCGPMLEKRLGSTAFALVVIVATVMGGVASVCAHHAPFISVGASGAIFGVMGALFALWVLGSIEVSPLFFLINFSMNFAFAAHAPNIDWAAHAGGFTGGVLTIAMLDGAAKAARVVLRNRFPEFVTANLALLTLAQGALWSLDPPPSLSAFGPLVFAIIAIVAISSAIKALDVVLSLRKGLAITVAAFAIANGALVHRLGEVSLTRFAVALEGDSDAPGIARALLAYPEITAALAAAVAGLLTLAIHVHPLRRGVADIGFVGATLAAERSRRTGV